MLIVPDFLSVKCPVSRIPVAEQSEHVCSFGDHDATDVDDDGKFRNGGYFLDTRFARLVNRSVNGVYNEMGFLLLMSVSAAACSTN